MHTLLLKLQLHYGNKRLDDIHRYQTSLANVCYLLYLGLNQLVI